MDKVTAAVESVTVFPAASFTVTTGWVTKAAPEIAPAGWVVKANLAAAPGVTLKAALVAEVRPALAAVRV